MSHGKKRSETCPNRNRLRFTGICCPGEPPQNQLGSGSTGLWWVGCHRHEPSTSPTSESPMCRQPPAPPTTTTTTPTPTPRINVTTTMTTTPTTTTTNSGGDLDSGTLAGTLQMRLQRLGLFSHSRYFVCM